MWNNLPKKLGGCLQCTSLTLSTWALAAGLFRSLNANCDFSCKHEYIFLSFYSYSMPRNTFQLTTDVTYYSRTWYVIENLFDLCKLLVISIAVESAPICCFIDTRIYFIVVLCFVVNLIFCAYCCFYVLPLICFFTTIAKYGVEIIWFFLLSPIKI